MPSELALVPQEGKSQATQNEACDGTDAECRSAHEARAFQAMDLTSSVLFIPALTLLWTFIARNPFVVVGRPTRTPAVSGSTILQGDTIPGQVSFVIFTAPDTNQLIIR